ncbi:hypothetical protein FSP39_010277, partial [Pinctada imbricata]
VEIHSSLLAGGFGLSFLPGILFDRYGPTWIILLGLLLTVPPYVFLWTASNNVLFYSRNIWLVAIYFLIAGTGSVFVFTTVLTTNIKNFAPKNRSKIVGLLGAVYAGSPSIISVIYYQTLQQSQASDSFGSAMMLFAMCFGCVCLFYIIFLRLDTKSIQSGSEEILISSVEDQMSSREMKTFNTFEREEDEVQASVGVSVKQLFSDKRYWLILCISGFISVVGTTFRNHLTVITKSVGLSQFDESIVIIIPISDIIACILIGVISDSMRERVPRIYILLLACVSFTVCPILAMIWGNIYWVLCIATVLSGIGTGIFWTIFPAVVSEMFHVNNLGRNWGIAMSLTSLLRWAAQETFGALYDNNTPKDSIYCESGIACVRSGLFILVISGVLSLVLSVILIIKENKIKCCNPTDQDSL